MKTPKQLLIADICNSITTTEARIKKGEVNIAIGNSWITADKKALYSLCPDLFTEYKNL